ncbi:hypothetical protein MNBD_NITROSPIRAE03-1197 [hydrothermal vent metagenome]|uniref:Uncharacterized protein n=1 Tax=hydrothermal vent metagenome TaxID=652676 RepID=A0A3B1CMA7_9ZZZZ
MPIIREVIEKIAEDTIKRGQAAFFNVYFS